MPKKFFLKIFFNFYVNFEFLNQKKMSYGSSYFTSFTDNSAYVNKYVLLSALSTHERIKYTFEWATNLVDLRRLTLFLLQQQIRTFMLIIVVMIRIECEVRVQGKVTGVL